MTNSKEKGYLHTQKKEQCFGCEACIQACHVNAIQMIEDEEGFRYPTIDLNKCVQCGMCNNVCPYEHFPQKSKDSKIAFGGYHKNESVREDSTSGGAFSAIVEAWCDENYVIFGARAKGLEVYHSYIEDKRELDIFRKSKYSQSRIGNSYREVKQFLKAGKKVLFSGTPCHIAGLKAYLKKENQENLLTVEVICEGVPSPIYMRKYEEYLEKKRNTGIQELDYRYKDKNKWDFQVMHIVLKNGEEIKQDRWFNPYWTIWLNHLMSRPSCYECPFTTVERVADISLGDLWGVHLYCPELYGNNKGASLIVCNTEMGKQALELAKDNLYGHELDFNTALKYQSPMRKSIDMNFKREEFMENLKNPDIRYEEICKRWSRQPSLKLLWSKYVWGNRQKVFIWNVKQKLFRKSK